MIDALIIRILENDSQSQVGLIPLAQKNKNDLITPTNSREHLASYLMNKDMHFAVNTELCMFQADLSLQNTELSERTIYLLLGSPLKNSDQLLADIYGLAARGIVIKLVCFAETIEFGKLVKEGDVFENIHVLIIGIDDDFNEEAKNFFVSGNSNYLDPDIEEAIKRSLIEK